MRKAGFHWKQSTLLLLLATISTAGLADDPENPFLGLGLDDLGKVEVTIATGTAKSLRLAPSVASVITAADIKAMGARTLDEALEFVPGLHVGRSFNRLNALYSMRGIHTLYNPQVLFLINGAVINTANNGSRPEGFRLPVANISRVEIIRGPGSAVFGADAFSGVINVITKDAAEIGPLTTGFRLGSYGAGVNYKDVWLQQGGTAKGWDIALSFETQTSEGDGRRVVDTDQQTAFDQMFGTTATLAPRAVSTGYKLYNTSLTLSKDNWKAWLGSWNQRDAGQGAGVGGALDPVGRQENDLYNAKVQYKNKTFAEHIDLEANLGYKYLKERATFQLFPPKSLLLIGKDGNLFSDPPPGFGNLVYFPGGVLGNPGVEQEKYNAEVAVTYGGFRQHRIRTAVGASHEEANGTETKNFGPGVIDGTSLPVPPAVTVISGSLTDVSGTVNAFMGKESRSVAYVSMQDEWQFADRWELTAGARYDRYSDFGGTFNPRLALVWATRYDLTSKLLYGRSFRAPSFTELYYRNNPAAIGNPKLRPETIDMTELVFDYRPTAKWETILNLYGYRINGLIDALAAPGKPEKVAQNAYDQNGYGFELEGKWDASNDLKVLGSYSWQRSENVDTHDTIADAPRQKLSAQLRYRLNQLCSVSPQAYWIAGRARASGDTRSAIANYTLVDATLRCRPTDTPMEFAMSVRNLTREDAREPAPAAMPKDFPLEGRNVYVELNYTLK